MTRAASAEVEEEPDVTMRNPQGVMRGGAGAGAGGGGLFAMVEFSDMSSLRPLEFSETAPRHVVCFKLWLLWGTAPKTSVRCAP